MTEEQPGKEIDGCQYELVALNLTNFTPLNGTNFKSWKEELEVWLGVNELDLALCEDEPVAPTAEGDNDATRAVRTAKYEEKLGKWERSNMLAVKVNNITLASRRAIPTSDNAKKYLANIEEQFKSSSKAEASTLIMKMVSTKYSGSTGIREHIMMMVDMAEKLKTMDMTISDNFLVHFIMTSLPSPKFEEKKRQKADNKDQVNLVGQGKRRNHGDPKSKKKLNFVKAKKHDLKKTNTANAEGSTSTDGGTKGPKCRFCKNFGHVRKDCDGFKNWLAKKHTHDVITFVDEFFYANVSPNTWCIDSGATMHITNSSLGFLTVRRLAKGEPKLRVADRHETDAEAVDTLPLLLSSGFILKLNNVLLVPIMRRNLISISMLDDDETRHAVFSEHVGLSGSSEPQSIDRMEIWDNVPLPTFHENFVSMPGTITPLAENIAPHPTEDSSVAPAAESSEIEHPLENVGTDNSTPNGEAANDEIEPMQTEQTLVTTEEPIRRSQQQRKSAIPKDYVVYMYEDVNDIGLADDPRTCKEAMMSLNSSKWLEAMEDELRSMSSNKVWDLVEIPDGVKPVDNKWVYKTKYDSKGKMEKFKARLVAKGFTQIEGIDYNDTFSPVSMKDSLRIVMVLVAHYDLEQH
ncbi:uncharacterized protein [Miscanthus floridulus]|uniref:uncharacterized protein n=1 Tax=Miscanthus floridulus TaxID=154761 RepID=UPI003458BC71